MGSRTPRVCPSCEERVENPDFAFCPHCGANMVPSTGNSCETEEDLPPREDRERTSFLKRPVNLYLVTLPFWVLAIFGCCILSAGTGGLATALNGAWPTPTLTQTPVATRTPLPTKTETSLPTATHEVASTPEPTYTPNPIPLASVSPAEVNRVNEHGTGYQWDQLKQELIGKRVV